MNRYSFLLIVLAIALCLATCGAVQAETDPRPDQSAAAHFGMSYIFTTITYMGFHQGLGLDKTTSRIFSAFLVSTATALKEIHDFQPSSRDMNFNLLGVGAAIGTTFVFEF